MTEHHAYWQDRTVFVTGATGLVGGWLVRDLVNAGADVVCLVRDHVPQSMLLSEGLIGKVRLVHGDLCDQPLLERALGEYEIHSVIHLAAQTIVGVANRNPVSTFESNIQGTWTLLEAVRRSSTVRSVVLASSDKAYGDQPTVPYSEDMPLQGRHPYDVSKSCADLIAATYANTYDTPVAITRCGNFYGGGDLNWNRIVPGTIRSALRHENPIIRSDGKLIRDYLYVEDGAAAYLHLARQLAERPDLAGRAYNFSTETPMDVIAIATAVLSAMNCDLELDIRNEASHEIIEQSLDASRARDELGWTPRFDLDEGLNRTIAWYTAFLSEMA